jgi:hypothetical protein
MDWGTRNVFDVIQEVIGVILMILEALMAIFGATQPEA